MFSELPKLLDRNFAVGFLLPAALLLTANDVLLRWYGHAAPLDAVIAEAENPWLGATAVAVLTWLTGLVLLGANRSLVRLKEGYGPWNVWWNPFTLLEKRKLRRLDRKIADLKQQRAEAENRGETFSGRPRQALIRSWHRRVHRFPDQEDFVLPTAFGNTIRAFEVYPRVMYGAESTELWDRLLAVVAKEYRELVEGARSQVDFWVNLWAIAVVLVLECVAFRVSEGRWAASWFLAVVVIAVPFSSYWSRRLAELWGKRVKSCFDVFLPELRKKLELPAPATRQEERRLWTRLSQAMEYHAPGSLPEPGRSEPPEAERDEKGRGRDGEAPLAAAATEGLRIVLGALVGNRGVGRKRPDR